MGFACRFLPGLRVAAAVACAAGDVPPLTFTVANAVGAFTWAAVVLAFVAWGGPGWLGRIGAPAWVVWALPAFIVLVAFAVVSRFRLPDSEAGLPGS
jgi:membrane protein DedA with SNARE-associated domain